jgi:DNA primase large subunit
MYYQRREDLISHYILRLAYCEQEDKKEWFINQECNLFKMRWERNKNNYEKKEFLKTLNLPMEVVSEEEKYKLKDGLLKVLILTEKMKQLFQKKKKKSNIIKNAEYYEDMFNNETYYKIPFEVVTDLVQNRTVFIKKGNAYVPLSNQISVIINEFRQNLKRSLDYLGENFSKMKIKEDERLYSIIKKIADNNVYETYKPSNNGEIKYQDIPRIAQYFPLCMKRLQDELVINSHLRHGGRMQYGLFLKGINLPLDESLKFWRHAFNKMTEDQFQKGYAYNIRHNYGKEGKRADYRPYSCNKIIMGNPPSTGEYHGCPFRHSPIEVLEVMLRKRGIKESTITQIIAFTRSQHYQLACRAMLEEVSGISAVKLENISYPNDYFNQCYPGSEIYKNLIKASNQEDTQNIDEMEF